jgi:hypothetical protein
MASLRTKIHYFDVQNCPVTLDELSVDATSLSDDACPNLWVPAQVLDDGPASTKLQLALSWLHKSHVKRLLTNHVAGIEVWAQVS